MVVTVIKTTYRKIESRTVYYHDFKCFCNNSFKQSLQQVILQNLGNGCDDIYETVSCNRSLNNYSPLKKKYVGGNHSSFVNKF